ncbi:hypothetical protein QMO14_23105 [Variovorax sp. CAN2819]|uniref:hypothetical protein n=1 Tax=Variovorax sp. CAN15 TaxID=3046727 RepID=UPI002647D89E|nr:hypothetical protein [Variovorax sp. CAN15]MDN6886484.1 hypothetical protein [Variovorax sp. CAN15]
MTNGVLPFFLYTGSGASTCYVISWTGRRIDGDDVEPQVYRVVCHGVKAARAAQDGLRARGFTVTCEQVAFYRVGGD